MNFNTFLMLKVRKIVVMFGTDGNIFYPSANSCFML
jgi:hypothetical protein